MRLLLFTFNYTWLARRVPVKVSYISLNKDYIRLFLDLIDALNHPLFGACWDTGHANEQGLKQQAMVELGSRLKAMHINDNDGIRDQHLLPYQGNINWASVVQSLKAIGYEGAFTYETHNSIRHLPEPLQQSGLKYAADVARYLTNLAGAEQ
jgi:L-ribulose-5-phosphate 3-epimerase